MSYERHHCSAHFSGVYFGPEEDCPVCKEIKRLNDKAIELLLEVERLKAVPPYKTQPVYRDSEAARERLRINAETIRNLQTCNANLQKDIKHHSVAFRGASATIAEQEEEIRNLKVTIYAHHATIAKQNEKIKGYENKARIFDTVYLKAIISDRDKQIAEKDDQIAAIDDEVEAINGEVEALGIRLQERDWLIDSYREKHTVMVEKVEELTPECEHCVDGEAVCPTCQGTNSEGARPDDCGHRYTCQNPECHGGKVPCPECGEGATP